MTEAEGAEPSDGIDRGVWLISIVVVLGTIGGLLSVTTVTVALDQLAAALHASLDATQWTVTGYLLGLAAIVPVTGWLGRRIGAKRLYLASLGLFALTSSLCALAPSMDALIALRVLQGIAGGAAIPIGQTILATAAGPGRMGRVMSVIGVPMVLAPVIGPIVGGVLIEGLGWQWLFVVNVPLAVVGLVLGMRVLPAQEHGPAGPLDVRGLLLLTAGVPLVVFGLAETGITGGVGQAIAAGPLLAGTALIVAFALHGRSIAHPLLSVALWGNRGFAACSLVTLCLGSAQFGASVLLPLYLQAIQGESTLATGLLLAPQGIGAAIAMPAAGRLTDRVGGGRVAIAGVVAILVSTIGLALLTSSASLPVVELLLLVRGAGQGAGVMPALAAVYGVLEREEIPEATPQLNLFQRIGGSIGTAVLTVVLTSHLRAALPDDPDPTAFSDGGGAALGDAYARVAGAFSAAFWWAAGIAAITLVPAIVLARVEARRRMAIRRLSADLTADAG